MHKEWFHALHSCLGMPTADLHTVLSLIVIRANVRKHIKADNVKNPSYIMQKTSDLGLFPLASTLMAKLVPSKPTQDICCTLYMQKSVSPSD